MGDLATLAKARRELEELYLGVPDESVNLTFQDLAELKQNGGASEKKNLESIKEVNIKEEGSSAALAKSSSLDFSKGFQAIKGHHRHHHYVEGESMHGHSASGHRHIDGDINRERTPSNNSRRNITVLRNDDVSVMRSPYQERVGGRRRPGIPHSNICTICSVYVYIFRQRCLVCGRVYCRQCVNIGMGELTEGRKCIECLGRRFSQRYIQRAGEMGCCARYPSLVKQQELKWAEKGPRGSGERAYGQSGMMSRSRSPVTPRTPARAHMSSNPPSFVMNSPYSAYSPTNHPIPF